MSENKKILFVEDNEQLLTLHKKKLSPFFNITTAVNGHEGLEVFKREGPFAVVISDMKMPLMNGIEFLAAIKDIAPDTVRMLITGFAEIDSVIEAVNQGQIFRFLTKPCPFAKLKQAVQDGIRYYELATFDKLLNKKLVNEIENRKKIEEDLKKANDELEKLSMLDPLTSISNRRFFIEQLGKEFERAQRYSIPLTLAMMDLDYFKIVNDTYGHLVGDDVLKRISIFLKENLRSHDVVARYGGEEFCIMLPETNVEHAAKVAERIRVAMQKIEFKNAKGSFYVSCSIGVASIEINVENAMDLISHADKALYKAKHTGRNKVIISSPLNE
jgi:diguanylate cyclase (GGDEF)-like protein